MNSLREAEEGCGRKSSVQAVIGSHSSIPWMHNLMQGSRKSHGSQTRLQYILQGALTRDNKEGIGKYCTCFYCSAFFFCLIGSGDKEGDLYEAGRATEGMR